MSVGEGASDPANLARWRAWLLGAVAAIAAALLVAVLWNLGEANRQRDRAFQLQSHSYEVMILARSLSATIARAEASLGRYVISTDRALGNAYADDWNLAGSQINRLDSVTRDNPGQQKRIAALRKAYDERGDELSMTALATNYGKNDQALGRYYAARRAPALAEINRDLEEIIAAERTLLDQRTTDTTEAVGQANEIASTLAVIGVLLVFAGIGLGWTALRARTEADEQGLRAAELEEAVAAATAELHAEAAERAEAEARLRQSQKMEAIGQLTGGIAHDFNNMLAVVLGGLELSKRHVRSAEALRHLDNAAEGATRAAALTRRLLAFARAEPLLPESIKPAALIQGMAELIDRTLGDGIRVDVRDASVPGTIWVDRHQLENAILNLAVNARDAMEGAGTLTIATGGAALSDGEIGDCAAGDYATIIVSDTGCGMSAETLERAFEPFFTTKPVGKGTGLGLSQIFALVRQCHGQVGIDSTPGRGTSVSIYLPRHAEDEAPRLEADDFGLTQTTPADLSILVVEDDPRVLISTMGALSELGHRPHACSDPLAAPGLLDGNRFDLIVSDVLMPGQTGPEMVAALDPRHAALPVLFVTGYAGELEGEMLEGHVVLRKPFTIAALERAVGEAIAVRARSLPIAAE